MNDKVGRLRCMFRHHTWTWIDPNNEPNRIGRVKCKYCHLSKFKLWLMGHVKSPTFTEENDE